MRLLVTGGAGRLGSELTKLLHREGHFVRVFDLPNAHWETFKNLSGIEMFHGDITDISQVEEACQGIDLVVHLAAILPPFSESVRDLTMSVNVRGTQNLLETLRNGDVPMIFASSISVYGITVDGAPPISENHPQQIHNVYSESKIEAERQIACSGIPNSVLRFAPIAVADLIEVPNLIPYRADQRVEFIDVNDAAEALVNVAVKIEKKHGVYNIAGGASWQMTGSEYLDAFYGALGIDVEPNYSENYTAIDWYDTSKGEFLDYQRTSFNDFKRKLSSVAEELCLI